VKTFKNGKESNKNGGRSTEKTQEPKVRRETDSGEVRERDTKRGHFFERARQGTDKGKKEKRKENDLR